MWFSEVESVIFFFFNFYIFLNSSKGKIEIQKLFFESCATKSAEVNFEILSTLPLKIDYDLIIMSHSLVWRHCIADDRSLFKQPWGVIYQFCQQTRFQKSLSISPSACKANKKCLLFHY